MELQHYDDVDIDDDDIDDDIDDDDDTRWGVSLNVQVLPTVAKSRSAERIL
jgi:hypothetical protein